MKIINYNKMIVANVGNLLKLLESIYGEADITLYPALRNEKLVFIARSFNDCVFIANDGQWTIFKLDSNDEIEMIYKDGYQICEDDGLFFVDNNDIQHLVSLEKMDEKDEEGYDGQLVYRQYNPDLDVMCEMCYKHMYHERNGCAPIYAYHAKDIDYLYITENYNNMSPVKKGFLSRKIKYYARLSYSKGEVGYYFAALKSYGLLSFFKQNSYCLVKDSIVRYAKIFYLDSNNIYHDFWPFGEQKTTDEIKKMIAGYGFNNEIPELFFSVYNGQDETVHVIQEAVEALHQVREEVKKENNSKTLVFTIHK